MHRVLARRLGALVATVLAAAALGHVLFSAAVDDLPLGEAVAGVPAYLADTFIRGDFGSTPGGGCNPVEFIEQCGSWGASTIAAMTGVNVNTMLVNVAAIEYGFALPGMFRTIRGAILGGDVAVMQALVIEGVILVVIANFLADAVQTRIDPRVLHR